MYKKVRKAFKEVLRKIIENSGNPSKNFQEIFCKFYSGEFFVQLIKRVY